MKIDEEKKGGKEHEKVSDPHTCIDSMLDDIFLHNSHDIEMFMIISALPFMYATSVFTIVSFLLCAVLHVNLFKFPK